MERRKKILTFCLTIALVITMVPALYAQETDKININKASVEELTRLKQIGLKKAQRIVDYREEHGPFQQPEDIMKVKGIGPKTFESNKDRITVK